MQVAGKIVADQMGLGYSEVQLTPLISQSEIEAIRGLGLEEQILATAHCTPDQTIKYTVAHLLRELDQAKQGGMIFAERDDAVQFVKELGEAVRKLNSTTSDHKGPQETSSPLVSNGEPAVVVRCRCGNVQHVPDDLAGKQVPCASCSNILQAPPVPTHLMDVRKLALMTPSMPKEDFFSAKGIQTMLATADSMRPRWSAWQKDLPLPKGGRIQLASADLSGLTLTGCQVINAVMAGADLSQTKGCRMDLAWANLEGAIARECVWVKPFMDGTDCRNADFSGCVLYGFDVRGDWSGSNLSGATLVIDKVLHARFTGTVFTGCRVSGNEEGVAKFRSLLSDVQRNQLDVAAREELAAPARQTPKRAARQKDAKATWWQFWR